MRLFFVFVLATQLLGTSLAIAPLIYGIGLGASAIGGLFYGIFKTKEQCQTPWVKHNVTEFEKLFDSNVFGQHLVRDLVSKALKSHLRKISKGATDGNLGPQKALVLSFHGWTGSGKNFVSQFIAQSLFKLGMKSSFVHLFISTLHFPEEKKTDLYKLDLQDWIRGNVTNCPQSIFIFDEIDKMPEKLIDAIKPFIDYHENINGVDFRKSIFIFLSNTGGQQLNEKTHEAYLNFREREDITYKELEMLIQMGAFNEKGGLHKSEVIDKNLINIYVPFLPMERDHVRKCAVVEAAKRGHTLDSDQLDHVVNQLNYSPSKTQLFSTTGCKRVSQHVDIIIDELEEKDEL